MAIAAALVVAAAVSCGDGDGGDEDAPTPTVVAAASPTVAQAVDQSVVVSMTTGCDRPEPERGTEALALVRVTDANGQPVIGADVTGSAEGTGVLLRTASDVTALTGEALLLFVVDRPGTYTARVDRVALPDGTSAEFDASSVVEASVEVGEVCVWPPE